MLTVENSVEDVGTGLKTAPFQCQGEKGGVNEGLGERAYGRVRGERAGRGGRRGGGEGTPGCHGVSGGDGGNRPGD